MSESISLGGIELKDVITFQTKIMMGAQFGRVKKAQKQEDIIVACLRLGWNDAFRHTSENVKEDSKTKLEIESQKRKKKHKDVYDDYICSLLIEDEFLKIFRDYALATDTKEKRKCINERLESLTKQLGTVKKIEGDKKLCFGHFQKLFNIALKLYLCLYMCKDYLEIADGLFDKDIIRNIHKADCPIDSIILDRLKEDTGNKEYSSYKWSKFGTEAFSDELYEKVQENISQLECVKGKSNLYYDFIAWKE